MLPSEGVCLTGGRLANLPSEGVGLEQLTAGCADVGVSPCVLFEVSACIVVCHASCDVGHHYTQQHASADNQYYLWKAQLISPSNVCFPFL